MGDKILQNRWDSSTGFLVAMIGAIIGLSGIWKFSYLMYENGGGTFLIPYILAIVIMAIPILVLEFGIGFKFKSSLPKVFYNIKSEFEIIAWFIVFLIFIVLIYYTCIMSWDLVYIVLSLFKGWGSNPGVFFTTTLLHSNSTPYGLTYLVVPIGLALMAIWGLIYLVSRKEINKGILTISKISLLLSFILLFAILAFALQLPGSRTGIMALFNPNWSVLLDVNVWLAAFGQLVFSYGLGYAIASTYSSYLPEDAKLIDNAWIIVIVSLIFEVLVSVLLFAIMGYMALGKNMSITSLVSDGFSLIFVVFPNVFNIMGPWVYIVAPAFFLLLFVGSLSTIFALMEPLSNAISEKFGWSRNKTVRKLVLVGLFSSFIFATGMGEYLLRITDTFICQFAIILGVLLELIVLGWVYDIEDIRSILNDNSYIKLDRSWVIFIRFVIPIILAIIWIISVYNLILAGDRQSLFVQSIIASIFVLVPLALTVIPYNGDYSLEFANGKNGVNYFKDKEYVDKTIDDYVDENDGDRLTFDKNGSFVDPHKLFNKFKRNSEDSSEESDDSKSNRSSKSDYDEESSSKKGRFSRLDRFNKSKNKGKNVLKNVDLSSKEFDSPSDDDFDDEYVYGDYGDYSNKENNQESKNNGEKKSKSLFEKINMFNRDKKNDDNLDDGFEDDELSFDEDYGTYDDLDYISPIGNEKSKSNQRGRNNQKNQKDSNNSKSHTFKSSKDFDISDMEDNSKSKSKPKSKPKSKSKKSKDKSSEPKVEVVEVDDDYEDFSDDFFDDGVFGDEGYESLLDDYVEKPKKSKSAKSKDKYYDYERKGADSVFNLDD